MVWRMVDVLKTCEPDSFFLQMPEHAGYSSPILHTIPLQLLAYYVALQKGTDAGQTH